MLGHLRTAIAVFSLTATLTAADPTWLTEANERIRQHRQTNAEIVILDSDGNPVPDLEVTLETRRHTFLFGTAIRENEYLEPTPDSPYRSVVHRLFNGAVLENWMKWENWEIIGKRRTSVDQILTSLAAENISVRGHTLVWQCPSYGVTYPRDIERLISEPPTPETRSAVSRRVRDQVAAAASHFQGRVVDWDVINEPTQHQDITEFLTPDTPVVGSPDAAEWFRIAQQHDPAARLFINDYHILVGDYPKQKDTYHAIIAGLLEEGAPLGGIGFQGHFHGADLVRTPEQTLATLDRFAEFGLPLAITEFDAYGEGWGDTVEEQERNQARFFEEFLTLTFSHPAVTTFFVWGIWDGAHWAKNAPFFRKDWTPKPALAIYERLVFDKWWTKQATATTDANGVAKLRVFNGEYEIQVTRPDASPLTAQATLTPTSARQTFVLPATKKN